LVPPDGRSIGSTFAALLVVGGVDEGGWLLPSRVLGAALVVVGTWLNDLVRVELGPDVVVVNFWRTLVLPWRDIDRFQYHGGAEVELRDQRRHTITAFSPPPGSLASAERRCQQAVRMMEEIRKHRGRR
jgi:hypothetical protein